MSLSCHHFVAILEHVPIHPDFYWSYAGVKTACSVSQGGFFSMFIVVGLQFTWTSGNSQ